MPLQKKRVARFKEKHQPGEVVKGRIIRYYTKEKALLEVEGLKLIAKVFTFYPEGTLIDLVILSLSPQILLKELKPGRIEKII